MRSWVFLSVFLLTTGSHGLDIALNGKACVQIVADSEELNTTSLTPWKFHIYRWAYEDFVKHLKLASGAQFNESKALGKILLGKAALTSEALKKEAASLPANTYVIRTDGNVVRIFGRNLQYTICGMYAFLRDDIGIEFLGSHDIFTVFPKDKNLRIGQIDRRVQAGFSSIRLNGAYYPLDYGYRWGIRMGTMGFSDQDRIASDHMFYRLFPGQRFAKSHPEYYAMDADGVRKVPVGNDPTYWQICFASQGAFDLVKNYINNQFNKGYVGVPMSPNDTYGFCQCPSCKKNQPPRREPFCGTDVFMEWITRLADEVKHHKNKFIVIFSYGPVTYPPLKKIPANVCVSFAPDISQWYDKAFRKSEFEIIQGWRKQVTGNNPFAWHAYTGLCILPPACYPRSYAKILKMFYKDYGFRAFSNDGYGFPAFMDHQNYLIARLLWNPELDENKLLADYFTKLYGKGGKEVMALYDFFEKCNMRPRSGGKWLKDHGTLSAFEVYSAENMREIRLLQKKARAAVKGDLLAEKRLERRFQEMEITLQMMEIYNFSRDNAIADPDPGILEKCILAPEKLEKRWQQEIRTDKSYFNFAQQVYRKNFDYCKHVRNYWKLFVDKYTVRALAALAGKKPDEFKKLRRLYETDTLKSMSLKLMLNEARVRENGLKNAGFEQRGGQTTDAASGDWKKSGLSYWAFWTAKTNSRPRVSEENVFAGKQSAVIDQNGGCLIQNVKLDFSDGLRIFRFDVWVYTERTDVLPSVSIAWANAKGRMWSKPVFSAGGKITPGKWTHLELTVEAPEDATHAMCFLNRNEVEGGKVYFDKAAFRKIIKRK